MGVEVRTLALFVNIKLAKVERRKKSLGWKLSCEFKIKSFQTLRHIILETGYSGEEM